MFKRNLTAAAVALAFAGAVPAQDVDLAKIREEMKQMKEADEQRMRALEKRLKDAEAKAGKAEQARQKQKRLPPDRRAAAGKTRSTPQSL